jgi:hypothetical protein
VIVIVAIAPNGLEHPNDHDNDHDNGKDPNSMGWPAAKETRTHHG